MALFLFIIIFNLNAFGQVQTLAEYNRSIVEKIKANKILSSKEMKTLRIRIGTEIASADDKSYKEGELFKLLINATYVSFANKNKAEEKALAKIWEQYSVLPSASNAKLNIDYMSEVDSHLFSEPLLTISKLDYITKFIPDNKMKFYFRPFVSHKCDFLASLRKTEATIECWKAELTYSGDRSVKAEVLRKKLSYLADSLEHKKEFEELSATILADKNLPELHKLVKYLHVISLNKSGQVAQSEADVEVIRKQDQGSHSYDVLLLSQLISSNKIDKATQHFKTVSDLNLDTEKLISLYVVSAFLFFERKEYPRAEFYLQKALDLDFAAEPLKKMDISLLKAAISLIGKGTTNSEQLKKSFESYNLMIQKNEVTDPDYVASTKLGLLIANHPNIDLPSISGAIDEIKKVNFPNTFKVRVLERLASTLAAKQKESNPSN